MYTFLEETNENAVKLCWFETSGRSTHEVATMFQDEMLSNNGLLKIRNNNFIVAFSNSLNFKFKDEELCHLSLAMINPGYMQITMKFSEHSYVAKYLRMPVCKIYPETIINLKKLTSQYNSFNIGKCPTDMSEYVNPYDVSYTNIQNNLQHETRKPVKKQHVVDWLDDPFWLTKQENTESS